ncbi:Acyl-CoA synthetase family member 3, mitochondrial, partial [Stegodyphus mimosarum]
MINIVRLISLRSRHEKIFPFKFKRSFCSNQFKPFQNKLLEFPNNTAVIDDFGSFKYKDILYASFLLAKKIKSVIPDSECCERISFLCLSDATYVSVLLACWLTGNVAVPLNANYPSALLEYFVKDSQSKLVIANERFLDPMQTIASKVNASFF